MAEEHLTIGAEKQELIEGRTNSQYLTDLLDETTFNLRSLCKILNTNEHDEVERILSSLVDRLESDLEKIEAVIADTLGDIRILVCTSPMDDDGKHYVPGAFYKAILEPKEIPGETVSLQ